MNDAQKPWLQTADAKQDGWLIKLASWYENDWERVIEASESIQLMPDDPYPDRPSVDSLIDQLPADRREAARSTLRSIDAAFDRSVLPSHRGVSFERSVDTEGADESIGVHHTDHARGLSSRDSDDGRSRSNNRR